MDGKTIPEMVSERFVSKPRASEPQHGDGHQHAHAARKQRLLTPASTQVENLLAP